MKRLAVIFLVIGILSGCTKQQKVTEPIKPSLSVEQVSNFKAKVAKIAKKKSWVIDQELSYTAVILPININNTYYSEILSKSKDSGYDFSKYLGKQIVEGTVNIKYNNGDVAGIAHFLFVDDSIVGAYYMVGSYIYSLNEREVFKKVIQWKGRENIEKKAVFKELPFTSAPNLIYYGKYNNETYLFAWEHNKLKVLGIEKNQFITKKEITLDSLYIVSMFFKDIDNDKKPDLALLVSNNAKWWDKASKSKLLIYSFDNLKQKYSTNFEQPMWSIDYDGERVVATSENGIEMYNLEDETLKKSYAYNKVGGIIKVDDIDSSGIPRYILRESTGTDVYIFQKNNDGLEEIWRTYNQKPEYDGGIQTADLNADGAKEIYLQDKSGITKKIVLGEKEFVEAKDLKAGHKYFMGDFNGDDKYEYFDTFKASKTSGVTMVYKY